MANTLSNSGGAAAALVFESTTFDVVDQQGQQWLKASDLARALGYSRSDKITRLFDRNSAEFTGHMTAVVETPTLGLSGNLVTQTRIFSLRGAHLLAMFARTAVAALFRKWVLDILDHQTQATRPMLVSLTISPAQAQHLTELVDLVVESGRQKTHAETWARFHRKMGVNKYSLLPSARFDEAVQYLRGKMDDQNMAALVQKHLPHAVAALPAPKAATASVSIQLMQVTTINGASTVEILPASELPQLILRRDSPFTAAEVLEVAQHANMRITNEVGRLERNSEAARMEKAILALGVGDLAKIAKSAWLELAYRAAGPGAGMAATA